MENSISGDDISFVVTILRLTNSVMPNHNLLQRQHSTSASTGGYMRVLFVIASLLVASPAYTGFGFGSNKKAPQSIVQKAFDNPGSYKFDDGGNISFGNGIYKRRFDAKGRPQVCHKNNYLYAGSAKKCVKPVYSQDKIVGCNQQKTVQLKTLMSGTGQICTRYSDPDDPWSDCVSYSTVRINKGPKVKVGIFRKSEMSSDPSDGFKGFTFLNIPSC